MPSRDGLGHFPQCYLLFLLLPSDDVDFYPSVMRVDRRREREWGRGARLKKATMVGKQNGGVACIASDRDR